MRSAAAVSLFAFAGCNQFFGLEDTHVRDAPPPNALPYASLLFALPKTMVAGGQGTPIGVDFVPVPATDVAIRVGVPGGALEGAPYAANGEISVPEALIGAPWRLEYTLTDGTGAMIVHELLWNPARDVGRAVVPVYGGLGRAPLPAAAGYGITPMRVAPPAAPTTVTARAFVTGIWAEVDAGTQTAPIVVRLDRSTARIGGLAKPDATLGDHLILVDYAAGGGCTLAKGVGAMPAPEPTAALSTVTLPWRFTLDDIAHFAYQGIVGNNGVTLRLVGVLSNRSGSQSIGTTYGYGAERKMPAFLPDPAGGLPAPPLVELAGCPGTPTSTPGNPVFANPPELEKYPRMAMLRVTNARFASPTGPELVSGIVAVGTSTDDSTAEIPLVLDTRMPFPITPRLASPGMDLDLDLADQASFPTGDTTVVLTFGHDNILLETQPDYLEVTLYRVQSSADPAQRKLIVERVYTSAEVATPQVTLDAAVFTKGSEYVFALRGFHGRPGAKVGDFTIVSDPQVATTIFTRTFIPQ